MSDVRIAPLSPASLLGALAVTALVLTGCSSAPEPAPAPTPETERAAPSAAPPPAGGPISLQVETVASGFENSWDVAFVGDDRMLVTERDGRISLVDGLTEGAPVTPVQADLASVFANGEGGLMGIAAYPDDPSRFVTCQTHQENGTPVDVRVVGWQLSPDGASATRTADPLVGGMPLNPSGRHSGCRPTFAPDGALLIGTGDIARGTIPQDRNSLGGKVLRVDAETGGPAPGNPFEASGSAAERLILTYGHRNVQGVAVQPGTGTPWSVEHGPDVDDEVNVLVPGGNYGWDPARGGETPGGYDESVPMTDTERYPDAVVAAWSSGEDTEATSGGDFLDGPAWGDLAGTLAVSAQSGSKLLLMRPGTGPEAETITEVTIPAELDDQFGRLRGARLGPDQALYVTTDNGDDDSILRITRN